MVTEHEPVGCTEIGARLGFSPHTVRDWTRGRGAHFPPFPPPAGKVHGWDYWDWPLVEAWFERTHLYMPDAS